MDETAILGQLEALAHNLGILIRYEPLETETAFPSGGLCRIKNKHFIIVDERAAIGDKIRTLAKALSRFDLSRVYLRPALRNYLEKSAEERG